MQKIRQITQNREKGSALVFVMIIVSVALIAVVAIGMRATNQYQQVENIQTHEECFMGLNAAYIASARDIENGGNGFIGLSDELEVLVEGEIVFPDFEHTLIGIGGFCDAGCQVVFDKTSVTIYDRQDRPVLQGWRESDGARLWRFSLLPEPTDLLPASEESQTTTLGAYSAYDMPSVEALVRYFHASAGFPVRDTWL